MNSALIVEAETLKVTAVGPPTGNIWLEIDGKPFPMLRWNDFVVVLLGWWINALLRLLRAESVSENVGFMDGPYTVEVAITSSKTLCLRALQGQGRADEVCIGEGAAKDFILGVISQAQEVLGACQRSAYWSEDVTVLESSLRDLEKEVKRFF